MNQKLTSRHTTLGHSAHMLHHLRLGNLQSPTQKNIEMTIEFKHSINQHDKTYYDNEIALEIRYSDIMAVTTPRQST